MTALPARYERAAVALTSAAPYAAAQTVNLHPQTVNLELYQGDDAFIVLAVSDPGGQPADLSGAEALSQIRGTHGGPIMAEFEASISGNEILLWLPTAQSTNLQPGAGVWDAQITEDGRVTTLVAGTVRIAPEVSW